MHRPTESCKDWSEKRRIARNGSLTKLTNPLNDRDSDQDTVVAKRAGWLHLLVAMAHCQLKKSETSTHDFQG